jgi:hypothetical protein
MATVTVEQEVLTSLHSGLHRLLYGHMALLVLLFALIGAGSYFGLKSYDKALQHAEALQAQFNQAQEQAATAQKALTSLLAQDAAQRAQASAQQASIEQQILARNAQVPAPAVKEALEPSATAVSIARGLQEAYGFQTLPIVESDGNIAVEPSVAKLELLAELDAKRFSADYQDEVKLYTLETGKTTSLSNDLSACQSTVSKDEVALTDAQKALKAYNKLTHRSKFRKILGSIGRNAERVGIAVIAFEAGRKL